VRDRIVIVSVTALNVNVIDDTEAVFCIIIDEAEAVILQRFKKIVDSGKADFLLVLGGAELVHLGLMLFAVNSVRIENFCDVLFGKADFFAFKVQFKHEPRLVAKPAVIFAIREHVVVSFHVALGHT
jgi:hypothetical protein